MKLFYQLLADFVVVIHLGYVAFVVVGQLLICLGWALKWQWIRNSWFRWLHFLAIFIVVGETLEGIECPLTGWEHSLRRQAGQVTHQGDFIANMVHQVMFFEAPHWVFTVCYLLFGLLVLMTILLVPPRWPPTRRQMTNRDDAQQPPAATS